MKTSGTRQQTEPNGQHSTFSADNQSNTVISTGNTSVTFAPIREDTQIIIQNVRNVLHFDVSLNYLLASVHRSQTDGSGARYDRDCGFDWFVQASPTMIVVSNWMCWRRKAISITGRWSANSMDSERLEDSEGFSNCYSAASTWGAPSSWTTHSSESTPNSPTQSHNHQSCQAAISSFTECPTTRSHKIRSIFR